MGVMNPGLVMRNIIPVVMAGVLGIYGLIVAVILQGSSECAQREKGVPVLRSLRRVCLPSFPPHWSSTEAITALSRTRPRARILMQYFFEVCIVCLG